MIELPAHVATRNSLKVLGRHFGERAATAGEARGGAVVAGLNGAADADATRDLNAYDHTFCVRESHDGF